MAKKTIVASSEQIAHVIRMRSGGLIPPAVASAIAAELVESFAKPSKPRKRGKTK